MATSISFSPTNDFLATSHVDSVGVYLWANRAQYADVTFQGIADDEVTNVALPSVQGEAEDEGKQIIPHVCKINAYQFLDLALEALEALTVQDTSQDVFVSPAQLDEELVTLTLLPRARWQTLLNLEVIQVTISFC